jgi:hypothetical protein
MLAQSVLNSACRVSFLRGEPEPTDRPASVLRFGVLGVEPPFQTLAYLAEALQALDGPQVQHVLKHRLRTGQRFMHLHSSFRRLSRETNPQCELYQRVAEELAELVRVKQVHTIFLGDFSGIDVPSMLILHRLIHACESTRVHFVIWYTAPMATTSVSKSAFARARGRYVANFLENIKCLPTDLPDPLELIAAFEGRQLMASAGANLSVHGATDALRHATSVLAYDLAYVLAEDALALTAIESEGIEINETLLLLDLNVFGPEVAFERAKSMHSISCPIAFARISYFSAVLRSKRLLDAAGSKAIIERALARLSDLQNPRVRLEVGWLLNASGLIEAMHAAAAKSELPRLMQTARAFEIAALRTVEQDLDDEAAYLRVNVQTNLVTAHEMQGEYSFAIAVWRSLSATAIGEPLGLMYRYRQGLLEHRNHQYQDAQQSLEGALACQPRGWARADLHFALAFVAASREQRNDLIDHLVACGRMARETHRWSLLNQVLHAALFWQVESDFVHSVSIDGMKTDPFMPSTSVTTRPIRPRSKLLACIGEIDLAFVHGTDFTRSLIERTLERQSDPSGHLRNAS